MRSPTSVDTDLCRNAPATTHLLCGYNGAGKTSLARELEAAGVVRFSLDEWMLRLYPTVRFDADEYGPLAEACRKLIWDVAVQVLRAGLDVVLDWNQWDRSRRAMWRDAALAEGFAVVLHHVDVDEDVAVRRATQRAAAGTAGSHALTGDDIRHLAGLFERPAPDEGIPIIVHGVASSAHTARRNR